MSSFDLKYVVWKEGDYYVSLNLNTRVSSFAKTKKGALESLKEALELYFEDIPKSKIVKEISVIERPDIVPLSFKYA